MTIASWSKTMSAQFMRDWPDGDSMHSLKTITTIVRTTATTRTVEAIKMHPLCHEALKEGFCFAARQHAIDLSLRPTIGLASIVRVIHVIAKGIFAVVKGRHLTARIASLTGGKTSGWSAANWERW